MNMPQEALDVRAEGRGYADRNGSRRMAVANTIVEEHALGGFSVEWASPGALILSKGSELFRAESLTGPRQPLGEFPQPLWKRLAATSRLAQRALRYMYYNVMPVGDDGLFLTFGKELAYQSNGNLIRPAGLLHRLRVLRSGCTVWKGSVYFGEYIGNRHRHDVPLYRYTPGASRVEVAHLFRAGTIRHIHGVYSDPYDENTLWCAAGDVGAESRLICSTDGFETFDVVGSGDESWRIVSMQFTKEAIYFATDAEFTQNHIYRLDRKSGAREIVTPVEGPVYYSTTVEGRMFFGVTAERCPSQQSDSAILWEVGEDVTPTRRARFRRDRWSGPLFLFGWFEFPAGPGLEDRLLFRSTAAEGDGKTFSMAL